LADVRLDVTAVASASSSSSSCSYTKSEEEEEEAVYLRFSMSHWNEFSSLLFLGPRAFCIVTAAEVYGFGIAAS
jgi:hypothetical protein